MVERLADHSVGVATVPNTVPAAFRKKVRLLFMLSISIDLVVVGASGFA